MFDFEKQSRENLASLTRDQLLEVLADNPDTVAELKIDMRVARKSSKRVVLNAALELYDAKKAIIEIEERKAAERRRQVIQAEVRDERCIRIREGLKYFATKLDVELSDRQAKYMKRVMEGSVDDMASFIASCATDVFEASERRKWTRWLLAFQAHENRMDETMAELIERLNNPQVQETDRVLSESFGQSSNRVHNVRDLEEHKARAWFVKVLRRVRESIDMELSGRDGCWTWTSVY